MDNIIKCKAPTQENFYLSLSALFAGLSGYDLYLKVVEAHRLRREAANYDPTPDGLSAFLFWAVVENWIPQDFAVEVFNAVHGTERRATNGNS